MTDGSIMGTGSPNGGTIDDSSPISLAEHFTRSEKFRQLFAYGMELVEETASFLDGEGRTAASELDRAAQALYGTESMRLTTRLMQLASWLLLQRAVADGEMTLDQAIAEKSNIKLNQLPTRVRDDVWETLPSGFVDLAERSIALQKRIKRLDAELYATEELEDVPPKGNPVGVQHDLLKSAFS